MTKLPHFADLRDGALVSLKKPASKKLVHLSIGAGAFGLAVIFFLIVAAWAIYPEPIFTQGMTQ